MRALAAAIPALLAIGSWSAGAENVDGPDESASDAPTAASDERTADEPATDDYVAPKPDGTYTRSCDYVLGDFTESATVYRFVADARLRNAGNIGTVTRVTARWFLAGGDEIREQKSARMKPGQARRVGFVHVATNDQIDLHQSLGYSAKTCAIKATIFDTFGEPRQD